jgi:hypothetical protein
MSAALAGFGFIFAQGNLRSIEDNDGISTHIFLPNAFRSPTEARQGRTPSVERWPASVGCGGWLGNRS